MAKRKKSYDDMTVEELRAEAAAQNVEGRSAMHRDDLVAALSGGDTAKGDAATTGTSGSHNATVGGEAPEPTDEPATLEDGAPKGAAHYPPSPSDQSGEKTDNIPPSKRLPPDVPASEGGAGADEGARLRAENAALAQVVRNLGGNPEKVAQEARSRLAQPEARGPKVAMKTATVTPVGGSPMEVEYPADTPKDRRDQAAIEAWKLRAGIWAPGTAPHIAHGEE